MSEETLSYDVQYVLRALHIREPESKMVEMIEYQLKRGDKFWVVQELKRILGMCNCD